MSDRYPINRNDFLHPTDAEWRQVGLIQKVAAPWLDRHEARIASLERTVLLMVEHDIARAAVKESPRPGADDTHAPGEGEVRRALHAWRCKGTGVVIPPASQAAIPDGWYTIEAAPAQSPPPPDAPAGGGPDAIS